MRDIDHSFPCHLSRVCDAGQNVRLFKLRVLCQNILDAHAACEQLIWGGVEFARCSGFRLPPEFEESKTLVGHLPEGVEIPWHLFGKDGKPLVIGDLDDILRRLDDRGSRAMPWDDLIRLPDDEE